eukprot:scaffold92264_cov48-Phaeocystis_antarctica.AAC.1
MKWLEPNRSHSTWTQTRFTTRSNRGRAQGSLTGLLHTSHVPTNSRHIPLSDGGSSPQQFPRWCGIHAGSSRLSGAVS